MCIRDRDQQAEAGKRGDGDPVGGLRAEQGGEPVAELVAELVAGTTGKRDGEALLRRQTACPMKGKDIGQALGGYGGSSPREITADPVRDRVRRRARHSSFRTDACFAVHFPLSPATA